MPTYDKTILAGQARQLGFLTAPFEKMSRLTEILRFLNDIIESMGSKYGSLKNLVMAAVLKFMPAQ